jgi:uncharacterized protein YqgC (DUF456 family)
MAMSGFEISTPTLWWGLSIGFIVVGLLGTVLPAIPGAMLVLAGIVIGAWIDGFTRVSGWTLAVIALLAVLSWVVDIVAALLGARRAGASPLALAGAAVGIVAGIFTGFVGLLVLPLAGAIAGEYWTRRDGLRATEVGFATWLGLLIGTVVKLVLVLAMVGIFAVALWM